MGFNSGFKGLNGPISEPGTYLIQGYQPLNRKVRCISQLSKDVRTKGHTTTCILNHGTKQY